MNLMLTSCTTASQCWLAQDCRRGSLKLLAVLHLLPSSWHSHSVRGKAPIAAPPPGPYYFLPTTFCSAWPFLSERSPALIPAL